MELWSSTTLPPLCTGLAVVYCACAICRTFIHGARSRLCCAVYVCKCVCGAELQRLVELISSYCSVTARYTRLFHTVTSSAHTGVLSPLPGQSPTCPYFLLHLLSPFLPHRNTSVFLPYARYIILLFFFPTCLHVFISKFSFRFSFFFIPSSSVLGFRKPSVC